MKFRWSRAFRRGQSDQESAVDEGIRLRRVVIGDRRAGNFRHRHLQDLVVSPVGAQRGRSVLVGLRSIRLCGALPLARMARRSPNSVGANTKRLIVRTGRVRSAGFIERADHRRPSPAASVTPATTRGTPSKNIKRAIVTGLTQDNRRWPRASARDSRAAASTNRRDVRDRP